MCYDFSASCAVSRIVVSETAILVLFDDFIKIFC